MSDPFTTLGLDRGADADAVRRARRDLARTLHPDTGGDAAAMQAVNAAAAEALRRLANAGSEPTRSDASHRPTPGRESGPPHRPHAGGSGRMTRDVPSFTIEALPAEAFEALVVAAAELGEIEDDDPPYELRVLMADPLHCWCQLDVVPDAGSSTVSLTVASGDEVPAPPLVMVRDAWIAALNGLDWSAL